MTAALALVDNGESLPGLVRENAYLLPPTISYDRWQQVGVTLQQMQRSVNWWGDLKGECGKIAMTPRQGFRPGRGEHHATVRSLAMHLDPTTLSPLPNAEAWWPRFVTKFTVVDNGCWLWSRRIDRDGYGRFAVRANDVRYAHRAAYVALRGPLVSGQPLDHECHSNDLSCAGGICLHRRCVNPWHCEPVTNRENILRGRSLFAREAQQTECIHGHAFTPENVYAWRGHRYCRTCRKDKQRGLKRNRSKKQVPS